MSTYYLNTFDSTPLFVHAWDEVTDPKGLVLVCHDVGSHSGRYEGMAQALNAAGYVVIAYDMRSFGATVRPERLGFGDKHTFDYSVEDVHFLSRYYLREYDLPLYLLGQGYGGYLILAALERGFVHPEGVALLSMGKLSRQGLYTALTLARTLPTRDRATTLGLPILQPLVVKEDTTLGFADPLDGVVPTVAFDIALIEGLLWVTKGDNLVRIDRSIPFALFQGMRDPALGKEGDSAVELLLYMREQGFNPRFFGYEEASHDLLLHPLSPRYFGHLLTFLDRCK